MARDPAGWSRSTSGVVPTARPLSKTRAPDGSELTISAPRNGRGDDLPADEAAADEVTADALASDAVAAELGAGATGRGPGAAATEFERAGGVGRNREIEDAPSTCCVADTTCEPGVREALRSGCGGGVRFASARADAPASQTTQPPTTTPHANALMVIVESPP